MHTDLPFAWLPRALIVALVYTSVFHRNIWPNKLGISDKFSPREIVTRRKADWAKHLTYPFGTYLEAHADNEVTNTMSDRTFPGIFCGTTGNIQGTMRVFDINTGLVKKCRNATKFPMPDDVIRKVNAWGKKSSRRDLKNCLKFAGRRQNPCAWNDARQRVGPSGEEASQHSSGTSGN